jgi:hypothetical protein
MDEVRKTVFGFVGERSIELVLSSVIVSMFVKIETLFSMELEHALIFFGQTATERCQQEEWK